MRAEGAWQERGREQTRRARFPSVPVIKLSATLQRLARFLRGGVAVLSSRTTFSPTPTDGWARAPGFFAKGLGCTSALALIKIATNAPPFYPQTGVVCRQHRAPWRRARSQPVDGAEL